MKMIKRCIDGREVFINDRLAFRAIRLVNRFLDLFDGLVAGQDTGQCEETRLHHGIDALAHSCLKRHACRVDGMQVDAAINNNFLRRSRQLIPHLIGRIRTIEQEYCPVRGMAQHLDLLHEIEFVTGDEICRLNQVRRVYLIGAESQMRHSA